VGGMECWKVGVMRCITPALHYSVIPLAVHDSITPLAVHYSGTPFDVSKIHNDLTIQLI